MRFSLKGCLLVAVVGTALGVAGAPPVSAQPSGFRLMPNTTPRTQPVTPIATNRQGMFYDAVIFRLATNPLGIPPGYGYGFGFPYGNPFYSPYPYMANPGYGMLGTPYAPAYNPGLGAYPPAIPYGVPSGYNPYLSSTGTASLSTNPIGGSTLSTDPYAPYATNPYIPNYSPAGGFLDGVASVTTANANAAVTYQKAMLVNQQVGMNSIEYRRRLWDEARRERMMLPNSEQMRLTNIQTALDRARRDPPLSEIFSGQSLNDLYNHLVAQQGKGLKGPTIALTEDVLSHINLTPGKNGNFGLLKNDIQWPNTLLRPEFDEPRKELERDIPKAVRDARFGRVGANDATDIQNNVQKLHEILLQNVADIRPGDYIQAKSYLNKLNEGVRALQDPNVNNYFSTWKAKGKTVGELIENMSRTQGLMFAPAGPGDDWAYRSLYNAMAAYDAGMTQLTATTPSKP